MYSAIFKAIFQYNNSGNMKLRRMLNNPTIYNFQHLIDSNFINIYSLENFLRDISILKCNNSISLPDCATIALATKNKIPALFAKKEGELKNPLIIKAFEIDLFFLEDFIDLD